jgi:probable phosphoglycerate mutase
LQTLILARHAHAASNEALVTSCTPPGLGLSPRGLEQALELRSALTGERIALGVTSELRRAQETLELAAPDVPRLVLTELNEIDFGGFEAGSLDEYRAWAWHAPADAPCPGGGESRGAAAARFARALAVLLARPEGTILAIGHALPIRYMLDAAAGIVPAAHIDAVPHVQPHTLRRDEVVRAAEILGTWSSAPVFRQAQAAGP